MNFRTIALATASLTTLITAQAHAQEDASPADTIIVTAQLRAQNPIEVPMTLTALSSEELERFGLNEMDKLSRFVPGFVVQNQSPNNPGFVMRGITSDSGTATAEPRVSVYQDGVSISKSRGSYVELFDIQRVEIAKGPQSTLYGRGALIGAVNIIQNKANPSEREAAAAFSYGNFNAITSEAMVNLPLGETTAIRLAGRIRSRDGYIDNLLGGADFNSADTRAIRGAFHTEAGALSVDVIGNYQKDTPDGTPFKSIAYNPTNPITGEVIGNRGRNSGAALYSPSEFVDGKALGLDRKVWGITGLATLELSDRVSLTSNTAYRKFDSLEVLDVDGTSLPILAGAEKAKGKQFTQEFRLAYSDDKVNAFVGASYFFENGYQATPAQFDERMALARFANALNGGGLIADRPASDPAPAGLFDNVGFTSLLLQGVAGQGYGYVLNPDLADGIAANLKANHGETATNSSRTRAFDVFGDVSVKLSDQFEIGGGLRYTHDSKRTRYSASVLNGRSILGGFLGASTQEAAVRDALLGGLAVPGAATIPPSALYPVPLFGIALQPTDGNGNVDEAVHKSGGFSWRFTARYAPDDNSSIYATYSRGRRPELLSVQGPSSPFATSNFELLPAEQVDSYELGFKTALADRTILLDGAVFYYQYDNFQTTIQVGTQFITTNAGKAENYGFEGQVRWAPSDVFSLFATYGYNHGRFKTGVREGNHFRLNPDHSAAIGAVVAIPAGSGTISFSPSYSVQSKIFFDDDNDRTDLQQPPAALVPDNIRDEFQDGYGLLNARLGYAGADDQWRVEIFTENLLNKKYIMDAGNTGDALGLPTFIAGPPRFYGVSASFRFGGAR
jgi:iron complex outermembrane receptor protein